MSGYVFEVLGDPQPKGSTRAFVNKRTGRAIVTSDNPKGKGWEHIIREVLQAWPHGLLECGVLLHLTFTVSRPKSVSAKKRPDPITKPDLDKLVRCAIDAMTGVVFRDDSQVINIMAAKYYGPKPGLEGIISWEDA